MRSAARRRVRRWPIADPPAEHFRRVCPPYRSGFPAAFRGVFRERSGCVSGRLSPLRQTLRFA
jgi:hypothetical protein